MRLLLIAAAASLLLATLPARAAPAASTPEFVCPMPVRSVQTQAELEAWCHPLQVQAAACTAKGGEWFLAGLSPPGTIPHCVMPTPDADHACTSNSQCRDSACVPDNTPPSAPATGHCDRYGHYSAYCFQSVDHGRVVTPPPCPLI